jgi:hypothetical protein
MYFQNLFLYDIYGYPNCHNMIIMYFMHTPFIAKNTKWWHFFFQALVITWMLTRRKGIKSLLLKYQVVLNIFVKRVRICTIQTSMFSHEKLRLKSEPQNYDIPKIATSSEVSTELCPSQY